MFAFIPLVFFLGLAFSWQDVEIRSDRLAFRRRDEIQEGRVSIAKLQRDDINRVYHHGVGMLEKRAPQKSKSLPRMVDPRYSMVPSAVCRMCPPAVSCRKPAYGCHTVLVEAMDPGRLWPLRLLVARCLCNDVPYEADNVTLPILRTTGWTEVTVPVGCRTMCPENGPRQRVKMLPNLQQ